MSELTATAIVGVILSLSVTDASGELATLVVERQECRSEACDRDAVVFVHGIFGSKDTWLNTESGQTWPELMIGDSDVAGSDIFRIDYETKFFSFGRQPSGTEIAESIFAVLRPAMGKYRRIHLICHSLGGNLIRYYLVRLKSSTPTPPGPHNVMSVYKNLFFIGTPVEGAAIATVGQRVSSASALRLLVPLDVNEWLQTVNNLWRGVVFRTRLSVDEGAGPLPLVIHAAYETERYFGIVVVPRESATALAEVVNVRCFRRNHNELAKPVGRQDNMYLWVKGRMLGLPTVSAAEC